MLVATNTTSSRPHSVPDTDNVSLVPPAGNPPVIAVPETHPIYGRTPMGRDGFVLERQTIHMLDYWHKIADGIAQRYNADPGNVAETEFEPAWQAAWDIYRAALKARLNNSREVAILLGLVARHIATHCGDDCEPLAQQDLANIAAKAMVITEMPEPTKKIAALKKGRRLTRAGLLYRYHAFLIGELSTLGVAFYGSRDYPKTMVPVDDAVNARMRGGKFQPFFNEGKLADRARSVLKSLKIDIVNAGDR